MKTPEQYRLEALERVRKTSKIEARVTKSERTELNKIAKAEKKTVSDLLRMVVNNYKKTRYGI